MMKVEDRVGVGSGRRGRRCPNKERATLGWRTIYVFTRRDFRFHTHTPLGPAYPRLVLGHARKCSRYISF